MHIPLCDSPSLLFGQPVLVGIEQKSYLSEHPKRKGKPISAMQKSVFCNGYFMASWQACTATRTNLVLLLACNSSALHLAIGILHNQKEITACWLLLRMHLLPPFCLIVTFPRVQEMPILHATALISGHFSQPTKNAFLTSNCLMQAECSYDLGSRTTGGYGFGSLAWLSLSFILSSTFCSK